MSLSTSTGDALPPTKRSPVLCNPWIRDVVPEMNTVRGAVTVVCAMRSCVYRSHNTHTLPLPFITDRSFAGVPLSLPRPAIFLCILISSCRRRLKRRRINRIGKSAATSPKSDGDLPHSYCQIPTVRHTLQQEWPSCFQRCPCFS